MPEGEHKAIAIRPDRIFRIEAQKLLPQAVNHGSHSHGGAGMPRIRLLHRIHGQGANRVNAQLIPLFAGRRNWYSACDHSDALLEDSWAILLMGRRLGRSARIKMKEACSPRSQ